MKTSSPWGNNPKRPGSEDEDPMMVWGNLSPPSPPRKKKTSNIMGWSPPNIKMIGSKVVRKFLQVQNFFPCDKLKSFWCTFLSKWKNNIFLCHKKGKLSKSITHWWNCKSNYFQDIFLSNLYILRTFHPFWNFGHFWGGRVCISLSGKFSKK